MGVAAVGVLYATVKRWFGAGRRRCSPARCSRSTPVAALMFRFNNPDALLVLLLVAGGVRADPRARGRRRPAGCVARRRRSSGFAFLAKELQAFLVLPGVRARVPRRRPAAARAPGRGRSSCSGVDDARAGGWWVAIVDAHAGVDAAVHRRFAEQQLLERALRVQRLRPAHRERDRQCRRRWRQAGRQWGPTGWTRLFNAQFGGQASWLLPAALILLVAGLVLTLRAAPHRPHARRAVLWGGWLLVTGDRRSASARGSSTSTTRSRSAPAIGALVGIGAVTLWRARAGWWALIAMLATWVLTVWWVRELLARSPNWHQHLHDGVVVGAVVVGVALLVPPTRRWVAGLTAARRAARRVLRLRPRQVSPPRARRIKARCPRLVPPVANRGFGGRPGGFGPTGNGLPQLPAGRWIPGRYSSLGWRISRWCANRWRYPRGGSPAVASPVAASPVGAGVDLACPRPPPDPPRSPIGGSWSGADHQPPPTLRQCSSRPVAHHGDRWVQRLRPHADPRRVPALRRERCGALFHRHQLRRSRRRPEWHWEHDFGVGAITLRLAYRRWCHHL